MQARENNLTVVREENSEIHLSKKGSTNENAPVMQWDVPMDKLQSVVKYCHDMAKKYPGMKPARIAKKAAEKFNLLPKEVKKPAIEDLDYVETDNKPD